MNIKKMAMVGNIACLYILILLILIIITSTRFEISRFIMENIFGNLVLFPVFGLQVLNLVFFVLDIMVYRQSKRGMYITSEHALDNMITKIVLIPAYLILFFLGLVFAITIMMIVISFFILLFEVVNIIMTGVFSIGIYNSLYNEGKISLKRKIIYTLCSFIFCLDVVISILAYRDSRKMLENGC